MEGGFKMSEENYEYASDMIDDIMPELQTMRDLYVKTGDVSKQIKMDEKIGKIKNLYKQSKSQKIADHKAVQSKAEVQSQINSILGLK
jgi:predicted RNA-binding protein with EMAP domain